VTDPAAAAATVHDDDEVEERALIQALRNGPYLVSGVSNLVNWLGERLPTESSMALCRCGGSSTKPLCDGTHARNGFTDAKDPKRVADRVDDYPGVSVKVLDNRGTCAHAGFCSDRLSTVFRTGTEPFIAPSGGRMDEIIRAVRDCPSGALSVAIDGREARDQVDHGGTRPPRIEVSKDGPYRITGSVAICDANGDPVRFNQGASAEHYSLCRCGHSQNKPFCSGMHWYVNFADPVADPDREPTVFEWSGGLPAFTRMTRLLYEKYVPDDPHLAPLFANMSPDHPGRVAQWLAEDFGGPASSAADRGGNPWMLSEHQDRTLTEQQRARLVALILLSAQDAALPDDGELRSALGAHIEWTSRLAVEASPPGTVPSTEVAAPKWGWTAAGPPRARISRLGPISDQDEPHPTAPDAGEPVTFDQHIKGLFRSKDRKSMQFAFDLWSYSDVASHADAILGAVGEGSMPCDAAWPADRVEVLQRWIVAGMPESASEPGGPAQSDGRRSLPGAPATGHQTEPPGPGIGEIGGALGRSLTLRASAPVEERALVIEHREPLIYMLCAAAELEHALMCEYLFAAFSLKRTIGEGLTAEQLDMVDRWRGVILHVAQQEMLHLAINCNLITALGASPHLSRPNLPQPAQHYPPGVILALLPFGEQALRHFVYLERPEGMNIDDAEGMVAVECAVAVMSEDEVAPHLQEFATVGHLYRSIEAGLRHLSELWGDERLFLGPVEAQARGELFGWSKLQPITSCDEAVAAIEEIVAEGEGPRGDWRNAHFGRFVGVLDEYLTFVEANPGVEVARPVLPAVVRLPDSGQTVELITDPSTARVADLGNVAYEVLLQVLYRLLCHVDETDEQIQTLSVVSIGIMVEVIEPLADILTTLPVGPEHAGRTAGPSFELFYQPDYLLPHRSAAWLLMSEHLADAAELAEREGARDTRLLPVAAAMRRNAQTLRDNAQ
jgi:CDGSH-type Zn-finger protein/truncated hemoglobin YjbI